MGFLGSVKHLERKTRTEIEVDFLSIFPLAWILDLFVAFVFDTHKVATSSVNECNWELREGVREREREVSALTWKQKKSQHKPDW